MINHHLSVYFIVIYLAEYLDDDDDDDESNGSADIPCKLRNITTNEFGFKGHLQQKIFFAYFSF